mgnify:CR=1 FL=1
MSKHISVKEIIQKVNQLEWSLQKSGERSVENAEIFSRWWSSHKPMKDLSTEIIREFKYYLKVKRKYSGGTINRKLAALSKLITYARGCSGFTFKWGVPLIQYERVNNKRKFTLTPAIEKLLISKTNELGHKEKSDLWVFLIDVGCRLGEALSLQWSDVSEDFVLFKNTKNGDDRYVPIFNRVKQLLMTRKKIGLLRPFPFTKSCVEWTWRKVRKNIGMDSEKDFVIHSLRHTCITRMLHHKIGIEVVQIAVGHNDIRMTQGYNHPTKEQLYSAIKQRIN